MMSRLLRSFMVAVLAWVVMAPFIAEAKGFIAYYTIQGPGVPDAVQFSVDLEGQVPFDHKRPISAPPESLQRNGFLVRLYLQSGSRHALGHIYYYPQPDGTAYIFYPGSWVANAYTDFAGRWFHTRPDFITAAELATGGACLVNWWPIAVLRPRICWW